MLENKLCKKRNESKQPSFIKQQQQKVEIGNENNSSSIKQAKAHLSEPNLVCMK